MSYLRSLLLLVLLVVAACDYTEPTRIVAGVDFDHLFARPSVSEIAAVEADWDARDVSATSVRLERIRTVPIDEVDHQVLIVSHTVAGPRHVGALLYPHGAASESLPVVMYLHGGDGGVSNGR